jgi:hypothetical protein
MRIAFRVLQIGCMAATMLMLASGSATGQIAAYSEPGDEDCGEVVNDGGVVSGGCHVEAESIGDVALHVYVPFKVTITTCSVGLEGVVGEDGTGYITSAGLTPSGTPCTREPCDLPWPAQITESGPGEELVEVTFCLAGPSGSASCTLHIEPFSDNEHDWEVGGSEYFCESSQPPLSIEGQFGIVPDGEVVEVVH